MKNNTLTSEKYISIWAKHFNNGNPLISFNFIKGSKKSISQIYKIEELIEIDIEEDRFGIAFKKSQYSFLASSINGFYIVFRNTSMILKCFH